jgi:hypothetical protein
VRFQFAATGHRTSRRLTLQAIGLQAVIGLLGSLLLAASPATSAAQNFTVPNSATQGTQGSAVQNSPVPNSAAQGSAAISVQQVSGETLGTPPPSPAPAPRYTVTFTRLHCFDETGSWYDKAIASDEPYVLIFAINLLAPSHGRAFRTQVFGDVDSGETRSESLQVWGPGPLGDPDDLIVLAQIMEHDESSIDHLVAEMNRVLPGAAARYLTFGWGHNAIVGELKLDMQNAIDSSTVVGHGLNRDDRVGGPQEVRITASDTAAAASSNRPVTKRIDVDASSSGDGHYTASFQLRSI